MHFGVVKFEIVFTIRHSRSFSLFFSFRQKSHFHRSIEVFIVKFSVWPAQTTTKENVSTRAGFGCGGTAFTSHLR